MASTYQAGPVDQYTAYNAGVIPSDVFGVAINWFVNRTPLTSRLPKLPVGSPKFLITNDNYRPRTTTIATLDNSNTTIVVPDASSFAVNDVLQLESEYVKVTAINSTANTLTVTRGYSGSAAAHANTITAYLIGKAGSGADVNVTSTSRVPVPVTQYCQTVQHAYQIGGALQADTNYTSGFASPLDRDRLLAMQHTMDDFEESMYYGPGIDITATGATPMMKGIKSLLATNNTTSPTNSAAYKPSDLVRDTLQKCFDGGGNPTILVVSTDFLTGLAVWGHAALRLNAGANVFGTPIDLFEAPFLSGISIIPAPLLRTGTAICLSGLEARVRLKRPMIDKPRGSRGDAFEGDIIMEGAIEIDNEAHHAWVSGVTAFAAA